MTLIFNIMQQDCILVGCLVGGWYPQGSLPQCMLRQTPLSLWTEFLTHASENIALPQTSFVGGKSNMYLFDI